MSLVIRGKITAETTKIDKEGDRETTWQVRSELSANEASELQQVMGRELWFTMETYEAWNAKKQERAGQLPLALDAEAVGTPGVSVAEERPQEAAAEPLDPFCAVCGHPKSAHDEDGCGWSEPTEDLSIGIHCPCDAFVPDTGEAPVSQAETYPTEGNGDALVGQRAEKEAA